jgi:hypothetical protein
MSITQRIRAGAERALAVRMERMNQKLVEQAPIPDSAAPSLEELQRILADLQKKQKPRQNLFLKRAP